MLLKNSDQSSGAHKISRGPWIHCFLIARRWQLFLIIIFHLRFRIRRWRFFHIWCLSPLWVRSWHGHTSKRHIFLLQVIHWRFRMPVWIGRWEGHALKAQIFQLYSFVLIVFADNALQCVTCTYYDRVDNQSVDSNFIVSAKTDVPPSLPLVFGCKVNHRLHEGHAQNIKQGKHPNRHCSSNTNSATHFNWLSKWVSRISCDSLVFREIFKATQIALFRQLMMLSYSGTREGLSGGPFLLGRNWSLKKGRI